MSGRQKPRALTLVAQPLTKMQKFNIVLMIAICITLSFLYIITINSLSLKGYSLNEADKNIKKLSEANQDLKLEVVNLRSSVNLQKLSQNFTMEEIKNTNYAMFGPQAVARNDKYQP